MVSLVKVVPDIELTQATRVTEDGEIRITQAGEERVIE